MPYPKNIEINTWYGLNTKTSKANLDLGFSSALKNMDLSIPGVAKTTGGHERFTASQLGANVDRIHEFYRPTDQVTYFLIGLSTKIAKLSTSGVKTDIITGLTAGSIPDFINYKNNCYVSNGDDEGKVIDGTNGRKWGILAPSTNPSTAAGGGGALTGTYLYKVTYYNSASLHESNANPGTVSFVAAANTVNLSSIPTSSDSQVTRRRIYRTTSGGSIYFFLAEIADNVTTTYADNTADASLGTTEVPEENDAPNKFVFMAEWDGRIFGVQKNSTEVEFSNSEYLTPSGAGIPEESFSQDNRIRTFREIRGIHVSPTFNELWVHLQGGRIIAIQPTNDPDNPYNPVIKNDSFSSEGHYSIVNIYNRQWFVDSSATVIALDASGLVRNMSNPIEPNLTGTRGETGSNFVRLKYIQACHYKKGTKNQYRFVISESGQTTFNRMYAANYLQLTPSDITGQSYPVWEKNEITTTSIGIVRDSNGQGTLYTGDTSQRVQKQDTGTNFDGVAIDWSFSIGWTRTATTPNITDILRWIKAYFEPSGNYQISMRLDYDFGTQGGVVYPISLSQSGDTLDGTFVLDASLLAGSGLKESSTDVSGDYNYVEVTFFGNSLNQVMELHNIVLLPIQTEGFRRVTG